MDAPTYFLVINGKPQGPFTFEELKTKPIKYDSFLKTPAMDDYKEAHELHEISAFFGFAKQYATPQYFAGFDLRLLATAIDWFIIFAIVAFLQLLLILVLDNRGSNNYIIAIGFASLPILKFAYQISLEYLKQGTWGKKMLNIKVTNMQGLSPSFAQILIRNLSKIISTAPFFFGYLYSFLNKKQQTLHDIIADTLVIKDRLI
jgi:uncharacterized RDD family membrane protein YckC